MSLLERPFHLLSRAGRHRAFWLGLPLLLYVWTLGGPFLFDDLHLLLKTERYLAGEAASLDLFRFATTEAEWRSLRDRGTFPWWAPGSSRIDLFRPVAEWSFCLDVRLFGRSPLGYRLVSLAWFGLALICIHRLYRIAGGGEEPPAGRRCHKNDGRAGVATFFFGISQAVTQPVTFISNRSDLLVIVGTSLAAWAYWRAGEPRIGDSLSVIPAGRLETSRLSQRRSNVWPAVLAAAAFAFALLSKESAVAFAGVIVMYEVLFRRRRSCGIGVPMTGRNARPTAGRDAGRRCACVVFIMAVAYLAYYAVTRSWHLGLAGGPAASGFFLAKAAKSVSLYLAVWTTGFPISALLQAGAVPAIAVAIVGAVAAIVVARHLRGPLRSDRAVPFFILWALFFLVPGLATNAETRLLCPATVGWAYLLACLLAPAGEGAAARPLWLRHWLLAVSGAVSIACGVVTVLLANGAEREATRLLTGYVSAQADDLGAGDVLIIAEAESPLEFICAGDRLELLTGWKDPAFACLTFPDTAARFEREDDHTLLVTATSRPLLASPMHRLMLGPGWKPAVGDTFQWRAFTAEITGVDDRDQVTGLRFRFDLPLTSPRLHFYPGSLAAVARPRADD